MARIVHRIAHPIANPIVHILPLPLPLRLPSESSLMKMQTSGTKKQRKSGGPGPGACTLESGGQEVAPARTARKGMDSPSYIGEAFPVRRSPRLRGEKVD